MTPRPSVTVTLVTPNDASAVSVVIFEAGTALDDMRTDLRHNWGDGRLTLENDEYYWIKGG